MATTEISYNQSYKQKGSRFATLFVLGGRGRGIRGVRGVMGVRGRNDRSYRNYRNYRIYRVCAILYFLYPLYILSNFALKNFSFLIFLLPLRYTYIYIIWPRATEKKSRRLPL